MERRGTEGLQTLALLLSAVAGGVDAIGWLTLGGIFVAHMSGNTIGVTTHVALGDVHEVARRVLAIGSFVVGLGLGAAGSMLALRRRGGFAVVLALEAALLAAFLVVAEAASRGAHTVPHRPLLAYAVAIALPAAAMGVQSATLRRVGSSKTRTTYITGVLTRFVEAVVDLVMHGRTTDRGRRAAKRAWLLARIWCAYAAGGVAAGVLAVHSGVRAVLLPLAGIAVAIALDGRLARSGVPGARPELP